jgi:hypothetical protein
MMPKIEPTDKSIYYATHAADIIHTGRVNVGEAIATKLTIEYADNENDYLGAVAGLNTNYNPLPAQGEPVEAGEIYGYGDGLVICRQSHIRTEHEPSTIPALFAVYQVGGDTLDWVEGELVAIGDERVYNEVTYICIQAHQTQFTPDTTPALWNVVSTSAEWQAGVAYTIGQIVTYQGAEYTCLQSHTSQVGWEPPNVPALWMAL